MNALHGQSLAMPCLPIRAAQPHRKLFDYAQSGNYCGLILVSVALVNFSHLGINLSLITNDGIVGISRN